ncbi:hypothetical protein HAX54_002753 [Datura stramonium]|uniref:Uncharacterized protein n=1 Tax=Datura stramonium TaxID=4076 RepID=A0ABS8T4D0_DATST|nr:hypothetical protein [Datura stramonium]
MASNNIRIGEEVLTAKPPAPKSLDIGSNSKAGLPIMDSLREEIKMGLREVLKELHIRYWVPCATGGLDSQRYSQQSHKLKNFVKAHARARKVQAKANIFKIEQCDSELLRDFVIRLQKEKMKLLVVPDNWVAEAFTTGLNPDSSIASLRLKESLTDFESTT